MKLLDSFSIYFPKSSLTNSPESELVTKYKIIPISETIHKKGPMSPYVDMVANHISSLAIQDSRA